MHMTTVYKIVLHDNGDTLGWSKKMKPNVLSDYERQSADILCTQFFFHAYFEYKPLSSIFSDITIALCRW